MGILHVPYLLITIIFIVYLIVVVVITILLQWLEGEPFIDEVVADFGRSHGICCNTTVRWATPSDADALVAVNKVCSACTFCSL